MPPSFSNRMASRCIKLRMGHSPYGIQLKERWNDRILLYYSRIDYSYIPYYGFNFYMEKKRIELLHSWCKHDRLTNYLIPPHYSTPCLLPPFHVVRDTAMYSTRLSHMPTLCLSLCSYPPILLRTKAGRSKEQGLWQCYSIGDIYKHRKNRTSIKSLSKIHFTFKLCAFLFMLYSTLMPLPSLLSLAHVPAVGLSVTCRIPASAREGSEVGCG